MFAPNWGSTKALTSLTICAVFSLYLCLFSLISMMLEINVSGMKKKKKHNVGWQTRQNKTLQISVRGDRLISGRLLSPLRAQDNNNQKNPPRPNPSGSLMSTIVKYCTTTHSLSSTFTQNNQYNESRRFTALWPPASITQTGFRLRSWVESWLTAKKCFCVRTLNLTLDLCPLTNRRWMSQTVHWTFVAKEKQISLKTACSVNYSLNPT